MAHRIRSAWRDRATVVELKGRAVHMFLQMMENGLILCAGCRRRRNLGRGRVLRRWQGRLRDRGSAVCEDG